MTPSQLAQARLADLLRLGRWMRLDVDGLDRDRLVTLLFWHAAMSSQRWAPTMY